MLIYPRNLVRKTDQGHCKLPVTRREVYFLNVFWGRIPLMLYICTIGNAWVPLAFVFRSCVGSATLQLWVADNLCPGCVQPHHHLTSKGCHWDCHRFHSGPCCSRSCHLSRTLCNFPEPRDDTLSVCLTAIVFIMWFCFCGFSHPSFSLITW